MFITDSSMWLKIADFARSLSVSEEIISKAKRDYNELFGQFSKTVDTVRSKYTKKELDNSLSMQNFYPWKFEERLICFYMLYLSGFRHTALRELRFYLESSARAYYIDSKYPKTTYKCKVNILEEVRRKRFTDLLKGLPKKNKLKRFYDDLCNYVHLSEITQTDARDPSLIRARIYRLYEEDKGMLEKTFCYSKYLLLMNK